MRLAPALLLPAALLLLLLAAGAAVALSPDDVAVVVNNRTADGREVADHYVAVRGLAPAQVVEVNVTTAETITRAEYDDLEAQLATALGGWHPEALVLTQGLPLRVISDDTWNYSGNQSSVDAELALLFSPLESGNDGRHFNPFFGASSPFVSADFDDMMLVSRLAGVNVSVAKALVDRAVAAEQNGTLGWGAFDGDREVGTNPDYWRYYWGYDDLIQEAYNLTRDRDIEGGWENSTSDLGFDGAAWANASTELPAANETTNASFYWGWYYDEYYYDVFDWPLGAVGMRLHSLNAKTLGPGSWVGGAVADGITGTMGHVWEPWIDGAPLPPLFFAQVYDGFTFGEAAWAATPYLSWQNVVVGDPLFRPVRAAAAVLAEAPAPTDPDTQFTVVLNLSLESPLSQEVSLAVQAPPGWGLAYPARVWLPPDGSLPVNLTVTLPMAPPGLYNLTLAATLHHGGRVNFTLPVTVLPFHNLTLAADPVPVVAPGDNASFTLRVINTGNLPENFALASDAERGNLTLDSVNATLAPGGTTAFAATAALPPDMTLAPGRALWLAVTLTGNLTVAWNATLTVGEAIVFELTPPAQPTPLAVGWPGTAVAQLYNGGNSNLTVTLRASPPGWMTVTPAASAVTLTPGETATQPLTLRADAVGGGTVTLMASHAGGTAQVTLPHLLYQPWITIDELALPPTTRAPITSLNITGQFHDLPAGLPAQLELRVDWKTVARQWLNGSATDQSITWQVPLDLKDGTHTIEARVKLPAGVDAAHTHFTRTTISIYPPLDLEIENAWIEVTATGEHRLVVTMPTDGGPVDPFTIAVTAPTITKRWRVETLPARFELLLGGFIGRVTLTVTIDSNGAVAETDETNNVVQVSADLGGEPEAGLPGPGLALAGLALAAAARRRR